MLQPATVQAAGPEETFEEREVTLDVGEKYKNYPYKYRLQPPETVEPGKTYPLVIFLHGAGERGTDNKNQLKYFPEFMAKPEQRRKYPCYILAPQCRGDEQWVSVPWGDKKSTPLPKEPSAMMQAAMAAIDQTVKDSPIDKNRIYLTGLSMGGYGSWDLAIRRPDFFAAVAPICGGGDETKAALLKNVPVWAVHGDNDSVVPASRSREMIDAIKAAGGSPKYTEIPNVGHFSWNPAYQDPNGLTPWMFEQKK